MKSAIAPAIRAFEKETGSEIHMMFGGSGALLSNLRLVEKGDLYLPADWGHLNEAHQHRLIEQTEQLAYQSPVLAVRKDNPKKIKGIDDLLKENILKGCANPESASIGKITRHIFKKSHHWEKVQWTVMKPTVSDLINDLRLGTLDVAVVWDALCTQHDDLVALDPPLAPPEKIGIGLLKFSRQKDLARKLMAWLASADKGGRFLHEKGFALKKI